MRPDLSLRERHQRQISSFGPHYSRTVSDAIGACIFAKGLDWFTDDQIAQIREHLIGSAWLSHKINRENRKLRASA